MTPKKIVSTLAVSVILIGGLAACKKDEECSSSDYNERRSECGYYDNNSNWILFPWIVPGLGGYPPSGYHPVVPPGVQPKPPVNPPKPPPAPAVKNPPPAPKPPPPPPRPAPPPPRVGK